MGQKTGLSWLPVSADVGHGHSLTVRNAHQGGNAREERSKASKPALRAPLRGRGFDLLNFGAVFFLPDSGVTISSVVETLTLSKWKSVLSHLVTQDVTIHLPKISHQGKFLRIKTSLQQIGITLLFYDIDLSDMVNLPSAALSDWRILGYQRFLPDSMGNMLAKPAMPETPNAATLTFTRPFYYIVWHKPAGTILYQGKVVRPMLN
jgi:serine protease inhibitor